MSANGLDLDGWKRQLERSGGTVSDLSQTDTDFTATVTLKMRATATEGWLSGLEIGGTRLVGFSQTNEPGGRVAVTAAVQRGRVG